MHTTTLLALTGATLALANPAPAPADPKITPAPGLLAMRAADADVAPRQFTVTDLNGSGFDAGGAICTAELLSLVGNLPTPTGAVRTWLRNVAAGLALPTDVGSGPIDDSLTTLCASSASITPPASLSSAYESFTSQFNEWASGVADEVHSIASDCGGQVSAMVELLIVTDEESCTKAVLGFVDVNEGGGVSTTGAGTSKTTGKTVSTKSTTGTASQTTVRNGGDEQSTSGAGSGTTGAPQSTGGSQGQSGAASSTSSSTGGAAAPRETGLVAAAAAVAVGVAGVVAAL